MTMRRLSVWMLVLVVAAPLAGLVLAARGGVAPLARGAVAVIGALAPAPALAQSSLEFKPVPRDSVTELERARSSRRTRVHVSSEIPATPAPGVVREPPAPPESGEA